MIELAIIVSVSILFLETSFFSNPITSLITMVMGGIIILIVGYLNNDKHYNALKYFICIIIGFLIAAMINLFVIDVKIVFLFISYIIFLLIYYTMGLINFKINNKVIIILILITFYIPNLLSSSNSGLSDSVSLVFFSITALALSFYSIFKKKNDSVKVTALAYIFVILILNIYKLVDLLL